MEQEDIVKRNELMIEYEIKIDSIVNWEEYPKGYTKYLESELIKARAKAEAYDNLMVRYNKAIAPKTMANILGRPIAKNSYGIWSWFSSQPVIEDGKWVERGTHRQGESLPYNIMQQSNYSPWQDSLTLPDEWGIE